MFRDTENMQRDGLERNMLMHLTLSTGNDVLSLNSAVLLFNSEKYVKGSSWRELCECTKY